MSKRKSREKLINKVDFSKPLEPIDIMKMGTPDDPCFGKLFDLNDEICRRCGDSTLCSIVKQQTNDKSRKKIEKENRFKDIEISNQVKVNKFIKEQLTKGTPSLLIQKKVISKFSLTKEEAKRTIKSFKNV
jgi:ribosomal protein L37E